MNKKAIIISLVLLAGAGMTYGYLQLSAGSTQDGDAQTDLKNRLGGLFGSAQDAQQNELLLYGNVDIRETQLSFNGSEHIAEISVEEGAEVKKGQLLARLHDGILRAQLQEAQAQLEAQVQAVNKLKAGARVEEINKSRAEWKAAEAQSKVALSSYERLASLLAMRAATPEDVDQAKALADSSTSQAEAIKNAYLIMKSGSRIEDVAAAEAILKSREAAVLLVQQRLDDAKLIAPADGIIRNRILEVGSMAFPQTPVMTLAFVDPVWVRAYLPEPALGKVAIGSKARIYTDSFPDKVYEGWVGYISPTAEFTPKNIQTSELRTRLVYSVRIFACNPQKELRLGMPATVRIDISTPPAQQEKGVQACGNE